MFNTPASICFRVPNVPLPELVPILGCAVVFARGSPYTGPTVGSCEAAAAVRRPATNRRRSRWVSVAIRVGSSEGEREGLNAGVEELGLERAIPDRSGLPAEL